MSGFRNLTEYVDAFEAGQTYTLVMRKGVIGSVAAASTIQPFDWSTTAGIPAANFYASSPLVSAVLDSGIRPYLPSVSPAKQFLHKITSIVHSPHATTMYGISHRYVLADYLLYYPFLDLTAVGEVQEMTNTVPLPRYTDGNRVQMMIVSQSTHPGAGVMNITYINQNGVQKTTPNFSLAQAAASGYVIVDDRVGFSNNFQYFVPLAAGDTGVRSVVSATVTTDNGGIAAIVLVKPLLFEEMYESSFRIAASAGGAFTEVNVLQEKGAIEIQDGAHLGFIGYSVSDYRGCSIVAAIETVWN